jgi:hypothetical protein
MLGAHPSKVLGDILTVTIIDSGNGVIGTKNLTFRIYGVFESDIFTPVDLVYVPLEVMHSATAQRTGECSEVWVWFSKDETSDVHVVDGSSILKSTIKRATDAGILPPNDLVILGVDHRYPKYLAPMKKTLAEAREVVDELQQEYNFIMSQKK